MLSRKDELRRQRAISESPQNKRIQALQAMAEEKRRAAEEAKEREQNAFNDWMREDALAMMYQQICDDNVPKNYNEQWNNQFVLALRHMPYAIDRAKDCWYAYTEINI